MDTFELQAIFYLIRMLNMVAMKAMYSLVPHKGDVKLIVNGVVQNRNADCSVT